MLNFPEKWEYEGDLAKCAGKTLKRAELLRMEYGCTWSNAWVVEFTDGTKAFFVGGKGSGIMNPLLEDVEKSLTFTPEEYAEMYVYREKLRQQRATDEQARERREYKRLKEKFENANS